MFPDIRERYRAGLWLAQTKVFDAKYAGRCRDCQRPIAVGSAQVGVYRYKEGQDRSSTGYMHAECVRALGIPAFSGKNNR